MNGTERIRIGAVGGVHGLRGEVRLHTDRRFAEAAGRLTRVFVLRDGEGEARERVVVAARRHKDVLLVTLEGVPDRTAAEALKGVIVFAGREDLAAAGAEAPYPEDLLGLAVTDRKGEEIGVLEDILEYPGYDMFVVAGPDGDHLVPAVPEFVTEVDLEGGRIVLTLPPGLLDINRDKTPG
ncbi:MAG: ribosome maturation factor RimM [Candidatus Eisenbacteria bacterium]